MKIITATEASKGLCKIIGAKCSLFTSEELDILDGAQKRIDAMKLVVDAAINLEFDVATADDLAIAQEILNKRIKAYGDQPDREQMEVMPEYLEF